MLIFDAHLDLAMNALEWNRDLRLSVTDTRAQERQLGMAELGRGGGTVSFPELKKGGVGMGVATLIARQEQPINHPFGRTAPEACYAAAHAHLAYYRAMERGGYVKMLRTRRELLAHAAAARADPAGGPFGFVLSMECADAILDPEEIHEWHAAGLRALGLTHYGPNRYGGGTRTDVGLALDALPLLKHMEQLGVALDLTHLSDKAFWQAQGRFGGRVLASHQNCRALCDWPRQFTDEQLKVVIDRNGVVGAAFDAIMLQPGWVRGETRPAVTMERAADHIDHVCQLAGSARHVGIGSDLDGGYGREQTPSDLDTIADLARLPDILARRGYPAGDIELVMHGNWLRFFAEALPA